MSKKLKNCISCWVVMIGFGMVVLAFLCAGINAARADGYVKFSAGQSKYALSGVWSGIGDGYEAKHPRVQNFAVGIGKSYHHFNVELTAHSFGYMALNALWSNPDDRECPTCYPTTVGIQGGNVSGLSLAFIPKKKFQWGDVHSNLGLIAYRATWEGDFFNSANTHGRSFTKGPRMHSTDITWFAGIGLTWGEEKFGAFSLDANYYPVAVDGAKYASTWSGGGGYKGVTTFTITYRMPMRN